MISILWVFPNALHFEGIFFYFLFSKFQIVPIFFSHNFFKICWNVVLVTIELCFSNIEVHRAISWLGVKTYVSFSTVNHLTYISCCLLLSDSVLMQCGGHALSKTRGLRFTKVLSLCWLPHLHFVCRCVIWKLPWNWEFICSFSFMPYAQVIHWSIYVRILMLFKSMSWFSY